MHPFSTPQRWRRLVRGAGHAPISPINFASEWEVGHPLSTPPSLKHALSLPRIQRRTCELIAFLKSRRTNPKRLSNKFPLAHDWVAIICKVNCVCKNKTESLGEELQGGAVSRSAIERRYAISERTLDNWIRQHRLNGSLV